MSSRSLIASTSAMSGPAPRAGCNGGPMVMPIGICRPARMVGLRPFVHTRWLPHSVTGISGTPAERAIRVAPDLNSLRQKLRLIVASGKTPTNSPARSRDVLLPGHVEPQIQSTKQAQRDTGHTAVGPICHRLTLAVQLRGQQ